MNIATLYTLEPRQDGSMLFAVFDRRMLNQELAAHEQLDRALFWDVLNIQQCFALGSSFVNMANVALNAFVQHLQEVKLAEAAANVSPMTDEDRANLAFFAKGLGDVNLDPTGGQKDDNG